MSHLCTSLCEGASRINDRWFCRYYYQRYLNVTCLHSGGYRNRNRIGRRSKDRTVATGRQSFSAAVGTGREKYVKPPRRKSLNIHISYSWRYSGRPLLYLLLSTVHIVLFSIKTSWMKFVSWILLFRDATDPDGAIN